MLIQIHFSEGDVVAFGSKWDDRGGFFISPIRIGPGNVESYRVRDRDGSILGHVEMTDDKKGWCWFTLKGATSDRVFDTKSEAANDMVNDYIH
jgi:hypothetical protein